MRFWGLDSPEDLQPAFCFFKWPFLLFFFSCVLDPPDSKWCNASTLLGIFIHFISFDWTRHCWQSFGNHSSRASTRRLSIPRRSSAWSCSPGSEYESLGQLQLDSWAHANRRCPDIPRNMFHLWTATATLQFCYGPAQDAGKFATNRFPSKHRIGSTKFPRVGWWRYPPAENRGEAPNFGMWKIKQIVTHSEIVYSI